MGFDLSTLRDGLEVAVISSRAALQQIGRQRAVLLLGESSERRRTGEEGLGDPLSRAENAARRRLTCHVTAPIRSDEASDVRAGVSPGTGAEGQVERLEIIRRR